jgi:hypothetical protein
MRAISCHTQWQNWDNSEEHRAIADGFQLDFSVFAEVMKERPKGFLS